MIGRWSGSVRLLRQGESGEGADENAGRIFDRKSEERELRPFLTVSAKRNVEQQCGRLYVGTPRRGRSPVLVPCFLEKKT